MALEQEWPRKYLQLKFNKGETGVYRKLTDLPVGGRGKITGFKKGFNEYKRKLMSMGLTPSTMFEVVRVAPMGDPVEIVVRDYRLSLRRDEAMAVLVEGL